VATSLAFAQFIAALITIVLCGNALNSYEYSDEGNCYLVTSSYNFIYSEDLTGNTFVQFLVFFMPWFHSAQAITNIISIVQYSGQHLNMNDLGAPVQLVVSAADPPSYFDSKWIGWDLRMLCSITVLYVFFAWLSAQLVSSDASEGRSLLSVLLPPFVRRALFGDREVVLQGDVRGEEREKSRIDKNVRAYKVSKTFRYVLILSIFTAFYSI
jgi:hypothetical protein